jgi:hypothetical protein
LLVNGTCHEHGGGALSTLDHQVAHGRRFEAGQIVDVDGIPMSFVVVRAPQRWIVLADRLYRLAGGPPVRGASGRLPERVRMAMGSHARRRSPGTTSALGRMTTSRATDMMDPGGTETVRHA